LKRSKLIEQIHTKQSFLCIGLDPDITKIPPHLLAEKDPIFEFNKVIIDQTRDLCVAYKPNLAFYEAYGLKGWRSFERTVKYIGKSHFIIADAKRGDIGNTSSMYARAFFQNVKCDAITVAPYMGSDSVKPFLEYPNKWAIVLALTSNLGSADFQTTAQDHTTEQLFEKVLRITSQYGTPQNMMFVIGATHPEAFLAVREIIPKHFLLVPGVGAQGGSLAEICRYGMNKDVGLLINASRSILYAGNDHLFGEAARAEALKMQQEMKEILSLKGH
jgi:orotidine-5'-phosphate decarboxylase